MLGVLTIFFRAPGTRPWAVLACLLLASLAEGIGIATLLPLVAVATQGPGGAETSEIGRILATALQWVGLTPEIEVLIAVVVGSIIAKALITMLAMRYVGYAVAEVSTGLRRELIQGLLDVRWDYFARLAGGRVANAVSDEATRAGRGYLMAAQFLALALRTAIYAGVAVLVSWRLALAALGVGAVIWVSLHFLVRMARKAGRRQTQRTAELVTYLGDALGNIKPLKAMAKQGAFAALLQRQVDGLKKALRRNVMSSEALKGMQDVMTALALGAGFLLAIVMWQYAVAEILVVSIVLLQMVNNLGKMQREYQRAVQLESPYHALRALIADVQAARERPHGGRPPSLARGLAFHDVSFAFAERAVLERVNFDVPAGTLAVITGPSGAGKTTLTDLLLGLREPSAGRILLDGVPLAEIDLAAWRGMIGYVPQEPVLFHDSVLANVAVGDPRVGEDEARAALQQAGAWDFVAAMPDGLDSIVGERGAMLSGGQRQRIALARALAARPKLLILDEVSSALDPETERDICRHLAGLAGQVSIVAITHRMPFREIADTVWRLEDGRLHRDTAPLVRAAGD